MAGKPALEWACATVGAVLVAATFAIVAAQIPGDDDAPPALRVEVLDVSPGPAGYLARFAVTNASKATAAAVEIEGQLRDGERTVETSRVRLDYAPRGSTARGGLWFREDPSRLTLTVRTTGYSAP
ncbi:MAG: hypothetical protein JWP20_1827 [Roseomonas sp.]|nr:hypothetical protein [Roseomonas sp.]